MAARCREQELLAEADEDGDGHLDHTEFRVGLARAGLALFLPDASTRNTIGAVAGEVLWNAANADRNGHLGWTDMTSLQQRHELARGLELPQIAVKGSGVSHDDFVAMVAQDDHMGTKLVRMLAGKAKVSSGSTNSSWALAMVAPIGSWSTSKKTWCCQNVGLGCTQASPKVGYDCKAVGRESWSEAQRAWCCRSGAVCGGATPAAEAVLVGETQTAAPAPPSTSVAPSAASTTEAAGLPYDCSDDESGLDAVWSDSKKDFCCRFAGRGCGAGLPRRPRFDCNAGLKHWERGWSEAKKDWCCHRGGRGCPKTTDPHFDCIAAYHKWETAWSHQKQEWCCQQFGRACQPSSTGAR